MRSDKEKVQKIEKEIDRLDELKDELGYDKINKIIRPKREINDPDNTISITASDANLF